MATVHVIRSREYVNSLRNYRVYLDNKPAGQLGNGGRMKIEVTPDPHLLQVKIDWGTSKAVEFDISENENRSFRVTGFRNSNWMVPAMLLLVLLAFVVNLFMVMMFLYYLLLPAFLLIVYFLTFGRRRYLQLKEV